MLKRKRGERKMPVPDALIVGAQRCGTTSMFVYLAHHPNIAPYIYDVESSYFTSFYDKPYKKYVEKFRDYKKGKISLEKSADYLHFDVTPRRVKEKNPNCKIIILLRNPVERAYSHYLHEVNFNNTEYLSFEDALNRRVITYYDLYHFNYLGIGQYVDHLGNWLRHFPPENIFVIRSEAFYKDPENYFFSAQNFLGLDPIIRLDEYRVLNKQEYEPMKMETRSKLKKYYKPFNDALDKVLAGGFKWK